MLLRSIRLRSTQTVSPKLFAMESKIRSREESVDRLKQRSPLKKIIPQLSQPDPARLQTSSRVFRRRHRGARHVVSKSAPQAQELSCAGHGFHSADVQRAVCNTPLWSGHVQQTGSIAASPRLRQSHDAWRYSEAIVQRLPLATEQQGLTDEACSVAPQKAKTKGYNDCEDLRQQYNSRRAGVGGAAAEVQEAGERGHRDGSCESVAEGAPTHGHTILYQKTAATGNYMKAQREPLPCPNPAVTRKLPKAGPHIKPRMEHVEGEEEQAETLVETAGRKKNAAGQLQSEASQTTLLSLRGVSVDKASWTTLATPSAPEVSTREETRRAPGCETVLGCNAVSSLTDAGEEAMVAVRIPCVPKLPECSGICSSAYTQDNTLESPKSSVFPSESTAVRRENANTYATEVSARESTLLSACASSSTSLSSTTQESKQIFNAIGAPPDAAALPIRRNAKVAASEASLTRPTSLTCSRRRVAEEADAPTAAEEGKEADGKFRRKPTISGGKPHQPYNRATTIGAELAPDVTARPAALDPDGTTGRAGDSSYLRNSDGSVGWCTNAFVPLLEAGVREKATPAAAGPASSFSNRYCKVLQTGPSHVTGNRSTSRSRSLSSRTADSSEECGCGTRGRQCAQVRTDMTDAEESAEWLSSEELRTTSPLSGSSVCCCCDCCSSSIVVTTASAPPRDQQHAPLYPLPPAPPSFYDSQGKCMSGKPGWYGHNYPLFRSTQIQKCGLLYWRWRRGQIRAGALLLLLLREAIKQLLFTIKVALSLGAQPLQDSAETSRRQARRPLSSSVQQLDKNSDSRVQAEARILDQLLVDIGMHQQQLPHVCAAYVCRGTSFVRGTSRRKVIQGSRNGLVSNSICEHCRHSPSVTQAFRESQYRSQKYRETRPVAPEPQQGKKRRERNYAPESLSTPPDVDTARRARGSKWGVKREEKEGHRENELSVTGVFTSGAEKEGIAALALTSYRRGKWLYKEEAPEQCTQGSCRQDKKKRACSSRTLLTMQASVPAAAADAWRPEERLSGRCSRSFQKASRIQGKKGTEERAHVQGNEGHKLHRHKESVSARILKVLSPIRLRLLHFRKATRFPNASSVVCTYQKPLLLLCRPCRRLTLFPVNILLKWRLGSPLLCTVRSMLQLPCRLLRQGPLWLVAEGFRGLLPHQVTTLGGRILEVVAREWTNLGVPDSDTRVRVNFVILLLIMYPFIHGVYIPCLALIWLVRRAYDACWWFCATRWCNYCTSTQQLHRWRREKQKQQRALQLQALRQQRPSQRPEERSPRPREQSDVPQVEQHRQRQKKDERNKNTWKQQQVWEASKKTRPTQQCRLQGYERQGRSEQQEQRHSGEFEQRKQQQRQRMLQDKGEEREAAEQRFQQRPAQCRSLFSQVQWLYVLFREFVWRHTISAERLPACKEPATSCEVAARDNASSHAFFVQCRRVPLLQGAYSCCILPALYVTRALGFPASPLLFASPSNEAAGNSNLEAYATPLENIRRIRVLRRIAAAVKEFILPFKSNRCKPKLEAVYVSAFKTAHDVLAACNRKGHCTGQKLTSHTCSEAEGVGRFLSLMRWSLILAAVPRGFLCISRSLQGITASVKWLLLPGSLSARLGARWSGHTGKLLEWFFSVSNSIRGNGCKARGRKYTEILSALNGQELILFSQPHVVVCGVGYTEKLTREELLQVVRRKLLVQREETNLSQQLRKGEGEPVLTHQREAKRMAQQKGKEHEPDGKTIEGTDTREQKTQQGEEKAEELGDRAREREEKEKEAEWRRQAGRGGQVERPCPAEETVPHSSSEDEAVPLLCFKHPRLRTAVRKVLHRYCWVRDENFSVARHVVSLNRQQVLALLALHQGQQSPTDFKTFEDNLLRQQAGFSQECSTYCCQHGGRPKMQVKGKGGMKKTCLRRSRTAAPARREETGENKRDVEETEREKEEIGRADGAKGSCASKVSSRRRLHSTAGRGQASRSTRHLNGGGEKEQIPPSKGRSCTYERPSDRCSRIAATSHCSCRGSGGELLERSIVSSAPSPGCSIRGRSSEQRNAGGKSGRYVPSCKSSNNGKDEQGETPSNAGTHTRCRRGEGEETERTSEVEVSQCFSRRRTKGGADCLNRDTFKRRSRSTNCSWTGDVKKDQDGHHWRNRLSLCSTREDGEEVVSSGRAASLSENRYRSQKEERNSSKRQTCNCVVRREEAQALVTLLASQSLPPALPLWQFVLVESVELPLQEQAASGEFSLLSEPTSTFTERLGCGSSKFAKTSGPGAAAEAESHGNCSQRRRSSGEEQHCTRCEVNAAATTVRDREGMAVTQSSRDVIATRTRRKNGSSHRVRRRVDGKATTPTYSVSTSRPRRRTARKEEGKEEKDERFGSPQRSPCTEQKRRPPHDDARHAIAERFETTGLQAAVRYETPSSRNATVEDSCHSLKPVARDRRKGVEEVGGCSSSHGAEGLSPKRSAHDSANQRHINIPPASNNRNSSDSGKPCVGSMVVFRIHHALADGIALTNMFLSDVFTPAPPKQQKGRVAGEQPGPASVFPTVTGPRSAAAVSELTAACPRQKAAGQQEQRPEIKAGRRTSGTLVGTAAEIVGDGEHGKAHCKAEDQAYENSTGRRPQKLQQENVPTSTPPTTAASSPASSGRYFDGEPFPKSFLGSSAKYPQDYPNAADSAATVTSASPTAGASPALADAVVPSGCAAPALSVAVVSPAVASARSGSCPAPVDTTTEAAATAEVSPAPAASLRAASCEKERRPRLAVSSSVVVSSSGTPDSPGLVAGVPLPEPHKQPVSSTVWNSGVEAPAFNGMISFSKSRTSGDPKTVPSNTGAEVSWSTLTSATCCSNPRYTADAGGRTANVFSESKADAKACSSMRSIKPLVPPIIQPALLPRMLLHIVAYLRIPWHVCSLLVLQRDRSWDSLAHLRRQRSGWAHDVHSIRFDLQRLRRLRRSLSAAAASTGTAEQTSTHAAVGAFSSTPAFRFLSQLTRRMPQCTLPGPLTSTAYLLLHLLTKVFKHRKCGRNKNHFPMCGFPRITSFAAPAVSTTVAAAAASSEAPAAAAESAAKGEMTCLEKCTASAVDDAGEGKNAAAAPRRLSMALSQWVLKIVTEFVWFRAQRSSCHKTNASGLPPHGRPAAAPPPEAAGATAAASSFAPGAATNPFTINELLTSCVAGGICRYVRAKAAAKLSQVAAAETPNWRAPSSQDAFALASFPKQASRVGSPIVRRSSRPQPSRLDARGKIPYFSSYVDINAESRSAKASFADCLPETSATDEALSFTSRAAVERDGTDIQEDIATWYFEGNEFSYRRERPTSRGRFEDKRAALPTSHSLACCSACRMSSARLNASRRASSSTARVKPPSRKRSFFADAKLCAREEDARRGCTLAAVCRRCRMCPRNELDAVGNCCSTIIEHASCSREGNRGASQAAERRAFYTGDRERTRADVSAERCLAQTPASDGKITVSSVAARSAASWPLSFSAEANACFSDVTIGDPFFHWRRGEGQRSKTEQRNSRWKAPARRRRPHSEAATNVEVVSAALPCRAIAAAAGGTNVSEADEAPATTLGVVALQRRAEPPLKERRGSAAGNVTHFHRAAAETESLAASKERQVKENIPRSPDGLQRTQQLLLHLNIVVPVNLRTTEEESFQLRNNFTSAVVQIAPADLFSAVSAYERLVKVRTRLRRSVRSVGACVFGMMERICFATTPDITWFLQMWLTNKLSLLLSNVPGPSELPQIHGRQVYMMHFVGSLVGKVGINASAFSYADNLDLVLHIDRAVLDSPDLLRQCIIDEYRELEQLCTLAWSSRGQPPKEY